MSEPASPSFLGSYAAPLCVLSPGGPTGGGEWTTVQCLPPGLPSRMSVPCFTDPPVVRQNGKHAGFLMHLLSFLVIFHGPVVDTHTRFRGTTEGLSGHTLYSMLVVSPLLPPHKLTHTT